MRTFLASLALFSCVLTLKAEDAYPTLTTLSGHHFRQVKVMKVDSTEIRIMHADGFATIALSDLPPAIRSKYGVADPAAEAAQAQQRKAGNAQAAMIQRQEREALQLIQLTGLSLEVLKQAVFNRDWCLSNPSGGMLNGAMIQADIRNQMLAQAMEILSARRAMAVAETGLPPGAVPPGAVPPTVVPPGAMPPGATPPPGAPAVAGSPAPPVPLPGFVPGTIEIISARYSLPNEQARNVKNRFVKLVPAGTIYAPVAIQVTDQLSDAALDMGNYTTANGAAVVVTDGNVTAGAASVVLQEQNRNVLTVEYKYNGQRYKKQAIEGSYIVLP